jgi:hypothetical protein
MTSNPEFTKVMTSFIYDIKTTFPEYTSIVDKWCSNMDKLFDFCKTKYPKCHKDILNKNASIFEESSKTDTEFLPHIHFKNLWQYEDLSVSNKEVIWGYLKLILLSLGGVEESTEIDLDEAFNSVQELFKLNTSTPDPSNDSENNHPNLDIDISKCFEQMLRESSENNTTTTTPSSGGGENPMNVLNDLFKGTLGNIAKDIASEMTDDLQVDQCSSIEDAMKNIFNNPNKIASLFKSVSDKLDSKMSTGEINNSDLLAETTSIMNQFKNIPGLNNLNKMFTDIDKLDKNPKFTQRSKEEKIKERLRNKVNKSNNKNVK